MFRDFKYPWEEEAQTEEEEQSRRGEQVVEKNWKSVANTRVEEAGKYGLGYWIYFQALKSLSFTFLAIAVLAIPKLLHVLDGKAVRQKDLMAVLAQFSVGNANPAKKISLGPLTFGFQNAAVVSLGILDVLQLSIVLFFITWFKFRRVPRIAQDPELRNISASDFAIAVDGLPSRLMEDKLHQKYDFEIAQHFETLLRSLPGNDPHSIVCEVALVRDFGTGLLTVQERDRAEATLRHLRQGDAHPKLEKTLEARIQMLNEEISGMCKDEGDRGILRAYVVFGTCEEKQRILREYRFSWLFHCCQSRRLRYQEKWPLYVSAAPEPSEIQWANFGYSRKQRTLRMASTYSFIVVVLLCVASLSLVAWWLLAEPRVMAAAKCAVGDFHRGGGEGTGQGPEIEAETPWHPVPGAAGNSEDGGSCFCTPAEYNEVSSEACQAFHSNEALGALVISVVVALGARHGLLRVLPVLIQRWRPPHGSDIGLSNFALLAISLSFCPMMASIAILGLKLKVSDGIAEGPTQPLIWEIELGWYLHSSPVVLVWCFVEWLAPIAVMIKALCKREKSNLRIHLWEHYARLISAVIVSVTWLPLLPILAPLAAFGLSIRFWSEKYIFFRGLATLPAAQPLPTTIRLVHVALAQIWCAVVFSAILAVWALGHPAVAGSDAFGAGLQDAWGPTAGASLPRAFLERVMAAPVLAFPALLALAAGCPPVLRMASYTLGCSCVANDSKTQINFQEAWLVMTQHEQLASFQIRDHPDYQAGSALKTLQGTDNSRVMRASGRDVPGGGRMMNQQLGKTSGVDAIGGKAPQRKSGPTSETKGPARKIIGEAPPSWVPAVPLPAVPPNRA